MVASYKIDTFHTTPDRSREIWREIVDGSYILDETSNTESGYKVVSHVWPVEEILFAKMKSEANTVIRTDELIASNPTPLVKVRIYLRGNTTLEVGRESFTIGPGAIHFIDHDRPARQIASDHEQLSVFVPYHAIGYDPSVHPAVFSMGLDTAAGRLLAASLEVAFKELDQLDRNEAPAFSASLTGTLRGAISCAGETEKNNGIGEARLLAIMRFIDQNLGDALLDADWILQVFNLSRATLFRDFANAGGVSRYIIDRRIQRAYRDLSEAHPARGIVQAVSQRWGFSSLAHFSRAFKKQYGVAPTSVVGRWADDAQSTGVGDNSNRRQDITPDSASVAALKWSYGRFK